MIISQIPLWSMGKAVGGPAFHATISHLARDHRVTLVTPELGYVDNAALPDGVRLVTFKHRLHGLWRNVPKIGWLTDTLGWYTFRWSAWPIVRDLMRKDPGDAVYGYEIYAVPVARKAADRFGVPMVARYQGTLMSTRRHERLATLRYHKHLAALKTPADLYVMTDDGTAGDEVLAELGHPADKTLFIMNGADRDILERSATGAKALREELGLSDSEPVLLTVSRLNNWKRVDRAIEVTVRLRESGVPATLLIAGSGPLETSLRSLAASRNASEYVHFLGGVPRDRLADLYRTADLLLSLYDYSNLANPVIEAMLVGTPVFALDAGGTDHLVHDGVNGVLLHSADPTHIAEVVGDWLGPRRDELEQLGASAAAWASENLLTWDERMRVEIDAIDRVIRQSD